MANTPLPGEPGQTFPNPAPVARPSYAKGQMVSQPILLTPEEIGAQNPAIPGVSYP